VDGTSALGDLRLFRGHIRPGRIGATRAKLGVAMERSGSQELTALRVAWDAWRATRGGLTGIPARQAARLEALVRHARQASRFYAEHYRAVPPGPIGPEAFYSLPPVTKPELMARFDDWVTDPRVTRAGVERFVADLDNLGRDFLDRYVVFTTSGSTGVPALLVQDRRAVAVMTGLAYVRALGALTPRTPGPHADPGTAAGGGLRQRRPLPQHDDVRAAAAHGTLPPADRPVLSVLDPMPKLVEQLNAFQPALLATCASVLAALTAEQEAGRLHISPLVITSGGELLTPAVQRRAEEAFGCLVNQSYAASEAMPLALPCQYGRLHLNGEWFLVEPIDAAGRPVPPGTRSDALLVTNLANHVQPVIRYQLGDSVVISDHRCACGTPLEETRGVRRCQVLQTAADVLTIRLDHDPGTDRAEVWQRVCAGLARLLRAHGAVDVKLRLAAEPPHANPRSGKLRHVLQALPSAASSDP
jgi:phenylacetate-CoA ligase